MQVLIGFSEPSLQEQLTRALEAQEEKIKYQNKYTAASITAAAAEMEYDAILLRNPNSLEELLEIEEHKGNATLIVLLPYSEKDEASKYFRYGIYNIAFAGKRGERLIDTIVLLLHQPRTATEARKYYGLPALPPLIPQKMDLRSETDRKNIVEYIVDWEADTLAERFENILSVLPSDQHPDLAAALPDKLQGELITNNDYMRLITPKKRLFGRKQEITCRIPEVEEQLQKEVIGYKAAVEKEALKRADHVEDTEPESTKNATERITDSFLEERDFADETENTLADNISKIMETKPITDKKEVFDYDRMHELDSGMIEASNAEKEGKQKEEDLPVGLMAQGEVQPTDAENQTSDVRNEPDAEQLKESAESGDTTENAGDLTSDKGLFADLESIFGVSAEAPEVEQEAENEDPKVELEMDAASNQEPICEHVWKEEVTESTCQHAGCRKVFCEICGAVKEETVLRKAAHKYQQIYQKPSCEESGYRSQVCQVCGKEKGVKILPPKGHSFGEWVSTENGKEKRSCRFCGKTEVREREWIMPAEVANEADEVQEPIEEGTEWEFEKQQEKGELEGKILEETAEKSLVLDTAWSDLSNKADNAAEENISERKPEILEGNALKDLMAPLQQKNIPEKEALEDSENPESVSTENEEPTEREPGALMEDSQGSEEIDSADENVEKGMVASEFTETEKLVIERAVEPEEDLKANGRVDSSEKEQELFSAEMPDEENKDTDAWISGLESEMAGQDAAAEKGQEEEKKRRSTKIFLYAGAIGLLGISVALFLISTDLHPYEDGELPMRSGEETISTEYAGYADTYPWNETHHVAEDGKATLPESTELETESVDDEDDETEAETSRAETTSQPESPAVAAQPQVPSTAASTGPAAPTQQPQTAQQPQPAQPETTAPSTAAPTQPAPTQPSTETPTTAVQTDYSSMQGKVYTGSEVQSFAASSGAQVIVLLRGGIGYSYRGSASGCVETSDTAVIRTNSSYSCSVSNRNGVYIVTFSEF